MGMRHGDLKYVKTTAFIMPSIGVGVLLNGAWILQIKTIGAQTKYKIQKITPKKKRSTVPSIKINLCKLFIRKGQLHILNNFLTQLNKQRNVFLFHSCS